MAIDYWITTHWPVPEADTAFGRHVYVKKRHVTRPKADDVVFVRESVRVKGKLSPTVDRRHLGRRQPTVIPRGYGGIIGRMTVGGGHRRIAATDVVYAYDDLDAWSIIECHGFERLRLPLPELMSAIGKPGTTSARFLDLWRVPDEHVPTLLGVVEAVAGR
jgi:hypothetical protein